MNANLVNPPNARLQLVDLKTGLPSNVGLNFLQGITDAMNGTEDVAGPNVNQIELGIGISMSAGTGSPNGVVAGNPGDLYVSTAGGAGTTFYVKETGVGTNTGWAAK